MTFSYIHTKSEERRSTAATRSQTTNAGTHVFPIQASLNIGQPNDKYETEADQMADSIMDTSEANPLQRKCDTCSEEESVQQKSIAGNFTPWVQMQNAEEEESIKAKPDYNIQQALRPNWLQKKIQSTKGNGRAMPDNTKSFMESGFGNDFSQVKIHSGNDAIQMNQAIGAEAFTNGNNIFFNQGRYNPETSTGKHLLAHELTHVIQQKGVKKSIQRKLTVRDDYPNDYVNFAVKNPKGKDQSKTLSNSERLSYVTILLGKLSSNFSVGSSGEVKPSGKKKESELVKDSKATASCCMHILTRKSSVNDWKILVADTLSPHTFEKKHSILINSELSPIKFGAHTSAGKKHMYDKGQLILGHEMCGHAALIELGAHPEGKRAVTNVHDPTVNIENELAKEQSEKKENLRGLANSGVHRGESFGKMVIERFKLNMGSIYGLPSSEQNKMKILADMIRTHDMFVELRGHSDNQGSDAAKQEVSDRRAALARKFLIDMGVGRKANVSIAKDTNVVINRFVLKGLSDKEPPEGVDPAQQDRFRRVEVFVASFPWALSEMPPGISKKQLKKMELKSKTDDSFKKPDQVDKLKSGGTPCEKFLIEKAYQ